ncbi:MAG: site-specific integrase [Halobacteriovoraceae bacterium]|nr:site-specific integrase [Halobacteriovoraceae bacterium]
MPIYTEQKNGKTTYTVVATSRINGKQVNKKKRNVTSIAAAKRIELDLKLALTRLKEEPQMCTWIEWSEKCLDRMKLQFKGSTVANYQSNFNRWVHPFFCKKLLDEIKPSDIHSLVYNKIEGASLEARHGVLKRLKRVFAMAVEDGIISRNPATGITVKVPESPQAVLNRTEINTLLSEAMNKNHRYYAHWALALLTGLRKGELIALTWSDIDFENRVISVTKSWGRIDGIGPTKSTKNRYVPISIELERFLKVLRSMSRNDNKVLEQHKEWLYGDAAKSLKNFCKEIGITPIKFHDLRATFITQMLLRGVPLAKVMKIVGHSTIKTTMRYLRLIAEDTQGATEELGIVLPRAEEKGNLVSLFK